MPELTLQASDDLVARIAREGDPVRAITELVWNAIDADASSIDVSLEREDSGAVRLVKVVDDGHGIDRDEVESTFGRIGGSWKRSATRSKGGQRSLHGEKGQGRLRGFALGSHVQWISVSEDASGARYEVTITGSRRNRDKFHWDAIPAPEGAPTGCVVIARNENQLSLGALEKRAAVPDLRSQFAPTMLNDPSLRITFDGHNLSPDDEFLDDKELAVRFGENSEHEASVRVIEWRSGKHRSIHFGRDKTLFPVEVSGSSLESQFTYSAYVSWSGFDSDALSVVTLGDLAPGDVAFLWGALTEALRTHFNSRRRRRRREQIKHWKDTGAYPYVGDPKTHVEAAERAIFDVVSGTLTPHISNTKREAHLTLELLRDALQHDPPRLATILHEVVALGEADRETLTELLSETTLSALIRSTNLVAGRNKFLTAIEHLLFSNEPADHINERDHLHKMLLRQLWVFGEKYHLMSSERGLTQLLRNHLELQGLPTGGIEPVRRWDGTTGRVDLHLAAKAKEHDSVRHLVVELKAPGLCLGRKELDQVEGYLHTVWLQPPFATEKASWDFVLVGTDYDEMVDGRIHEEHRDTGRFLAPPPRPGHPQVQAFVRRWRDVLDENRRRLDFFTSALEHDPTVGEGLDHLKQEYSDILPEQLLRA